ncbi:transglycosylase SLT domain-containing protein [Candidatus Parabeggiatoa sp. HSG14]|uniref:transglycosylase SLT domain-containing protein n=1 Tax=Candidatus Parabeggiatoa sp. HSG14 TaxID=3055593 RepID=UPI0025A69E3C|nr:transglycosylase SLT domain-containing protein [Thiotrichales bacterium HSG14]
MKKNIIYIMSIPLLLMGLSTAYANVLLQQRWQFKEIYQSILDMELSTLKKRGAKLRGYPIAHYLHYLYLKNNLGKEKPQIIHAFLKRYKDSPITKPLRKAWLKLLAKKRDWKNFIVAYIPQKNTVLRCYYLRAYLHTQKQLKDRLLGEAKSLWLHGKSQPKVCDPVFNYLYKNDHITSQLRWQRIGLAMKMGNLRLARYLTKNLSKSDKILVARWQNIHRKPIIALKNFKHPDTPQARKILLHGLQRLAQTNAGSAYRYWKTDFKQRYAFSKKGNTGLFRYIALKSAAQNHPKAALWLSKVDKDLADDQVNQARLQIALKKQDWQAVVKMIHSLPILEQKKLQFQYWKGRALEQTGKTKKAEFIFRKLAKNRHYYGFLASERLGQPYEFHYQWLKVSKNSKKRLLKKYAGVIRARELYFVGLTKEARAEWEAVLPRFKTKELEVVAVLAHEWGWHDRAIVAIAKAKHFNNLKIRFPLPFYDEVLTHAQAKQLNFAYVYAIIRQESAFQTDDRSVSGALGLMHLMPNTAKEVARKHKIRLKNIEEDLFVPDLNITLGTAYLREMLNKFDGNHLLATVAYNAGPTRAKRWAKKYSCLSPDIWVELIPFRQTHDYVRHVLSYIPIFESQMVEHHQVKPMRLDPIQTEECSG